MQVRVAKSGRVTIPKVLYQESDIASDTLLDFVTQVSKFVAIKINQSDSQDNVNKVYGCLKINRSSDEIVRELRGDR